MVVFPLSLLFLGCNSLFMILMMRISPLINSHLEVSLLNISDADSITRTQKQQKHTHTQEIFKIDQIISPSKKINGIFGNFLKSLHLPLQMDSFCPGAIGPRTARPMGLESQNAYLRQQRHGQRGGTGEKIRENWH